jgi:hypothetical protein
VIQQWWSVTHAVIAAKAAIQYTQVHRCERTGHTLTGGDYWIVAFAAMTGTFGC